MISDVSFDVNVSILLLLGIDNQIFPANIQTTLHHPEAWEIDVNMKIQCLFIHTTSSLER